MLSYLDLCDLFHNVLIMMMYNIVTLCPPIDVLIVMITLSKFVFEIRCSIVFELLLFHKT